MTLHQRPLSPRGGTTILRLGCRLSYMLVAVSFKIIAMRLTNLTLQNFRNYKQISINVDADLVLILGENASGKTNFLESIYFLSRLKSFRAPDNLLITHQQD